MYITNTLLARHVRESNAIEDLRARPGSAFYGSHAAAAKLVARESRQRLIHPLELHGMLCAGTSLQVFGGIYRTCPLWVGDKRLPEPEHLPVLMEEWWHLVHLVDREHRRSVPAMRDKLCFILHHILLCIHPFEDGNGRTARLFLNHLRLRFGLPWLVIEKKRSTAYVRIIAKYEEGFRARHAYAYQKLNPA